MSLSRHFIERPVATTLLSVALTGLGAIAYTQLPIAPLPQIEYPVISVTAALPGASPETMAATVATPLERTLGALAGVNEITSTSTQGSTRITLQFDLDRSLDGAARAVQAALQNARTLLPSGMPSPPAYRKVNPADPPIAILALSAEHTPLPALYDRAATVLAQRLAQVKGVGDVGLGGGSLPAIRIAVDPAKAAAQGLSLQELRLAVVQAHGQRPQGQVEDADRQWQVGANDQVKRAADVAPMIVSYRNGSAVRLQDVAEVRDSVQDLRAHGVANGKPSVLLMLYRAPNANILETVDAVRALLPQLRGMLPGDARLDVVMERTATIRASIAEAQKTLALSVLLVVAVVFAFLRSWRATLIPAVVVPVALVGSFGAMHLLGYSLDNLSLMALIIASGFVVDDAIVVLENIRRHLERGKTALQAAVDGVREIGFTVLAISAALTAAFIPILFMGGIVGRLFREFAVVLAVCIALSLLVSLTTTPMLAARLLAARSTHRPKRAAILAGLAQRAAAGYRRLLRAALRRPLWVLGLLGAVVAADVALYRALPKGFFPAQDNGRIIGQVMVDQGSSFASLKAKLDTFAAIVQRDPAVASVAASTGGNNPRGAQMFVMLKPLAERGISAEQVVARLRPQLARVAGGSLFLRAGQDVRIGGRQSSAEYQYTLLSDDVAELSRWEPRVRQALSRLPELEDVDGDRQDRGPQSSVIVDRDAATRLGIDMRTVDNALYDAFGQRPIGVIYQAMNQYRLVLEVAAERQGPELLRQLMLPAGGGVQVPLAAVARFEPALAPLSINHERGGPATTLSFNLAPGVSLEQATAAVDRAVSGLGLPVSVRGVFSGTANAFRDALQGQPVLVLAAVITVYLLLGVLYESLLHPLTLLSTLPSAGVGALLALQLTGTEFSVIAMIGVVLLIGLVMKNAILMIDLALARQKAALSDDSRQEAAPSDDPRQEAAPSDDPRQEAALSDHSRQAAAPAGESLQHAAPEGAAAARATIAPGPAIYRAAVRRLRPILMTTAAALLGALPLALGWGMGAELRQPLGIAVVGGLALSQMLTLFTTPVVFVLLDRLSGRVRSVIGRRGTQRRFPRALPAPT